jgi:creatinine amidohydrolase/Fe(II)-dependent formamide hydrolase-like protein
MNRFLVTVVAIVPAITVALAQTTAARPALTAGKPAVPRSAKARTPLVEFEMMTWPEVKQALVEGKTTALFYTGGTEQRGPQNANGGHNLMAKATVKAIALKLGNAIAMPVLPYTPNNASAQLPGTIGLTNEILAAILERISEQAILTGFKNVILMGDHGGGQPNVYRDVARKLEDKYAPQGIHVYYCDEVYAKAQNDFTNWLESHGYPRSSHAGIPDTSEMLYLGGDTWVRRGLLKTAVGDPVPLPGQVRRGPADANAALRVNNGITGDARRSSAALGKMAFDMKVDYAVKQIRGFPGMMSKPTPPQ